MHKMLNFPLLNLNAFEKMAPGDIVKCMHGSQKIFFLQLEFNICDSGFLIFAPLNCGAAHDLIEQMMPEGSISFDLRHQNIIDWYRCHGIISSELISKDMLVFELLKL